MTDRYAAAGQFVVVRSSSRSYRSPEPVAGPFANWRDAFLTRCRLSAAARGTAGEADAFEVLPT